MNSQKTIAYNTWVEKDGDHVRVIYYKTAVVTFNKAEIRLNTGGWWTRSTKDRMNRVSQKFDLGFRVFEKEKQWWVEYQNETYRFETEKVRIDRQSGEVTPEE